MTQASNNIEQSFTKAYAANGFNGTQAYLSVRPKVTYETAATAASVLLKKPEVQEALDLLLTKGDDKNLAKRVATRDHLILETHEIYEKAKGKEQFKTALSAIDQKGRLNRVYDKDVADMTGYATLMQSIQVTQVNVNVLDDTGEAEAINITPVDKIEE